MSDERATYEVSGEEHAADGARTAKPSASAPFQGTSPLAAAQRAHKVLNRHDPARVPNKISTPCPSCGRRSLFIGANGHLTCAALECPEPVVEDAIQLLQIEARLTQLLRALAVEEERKKLQQAYRDYLKLEAYTRRTMESIGEEHDMAPAIRNDALGHWRELEPWQRERLQRG